jgi:signal transduction histidine kinase
MTGNVQLELEPVDLAVLAEATVQTLRPTADAKTVRLTNDVSSSASLVNGDGRRLQQVLWNLVHNAVKFTPGGGHVVVGVHASDDVVRLVVTDSGCGISPAFLPYVFERFRQEDPSSTRQSHGLGVGLSIARHLAELHGGTIRAASAGPGLGSTFVLELPRAASAAVAMPLGVAEHAGD